MRIIDGFKRHVPLAFAIAMLGCGGSDGGGAEPGTGGSSGVGGSSSSAGGTSSSGGSTNGGGTCSTASDLEEVLAPVELPLGSVIRYLASDGEYVYFSGLQTLNRVPAAGGTYETLWDGGDGALYIPFFLRETDLVVVRGTQVFSVPKAGGDPTDLATLPARPYGALDGRLDFVLDGNTGYFKRETGIGDDPVTLDLYSVDLESGESTHLGTMDSGKGSLLAKSGDFLYIRTPDPDAPEPTDEFQPRPTALYRLSTSGGEFERVTVSFPGTREFNFSPIGGDRDSVFLTAIALQEHTDDFGAVDQAGLYVVPQAGGDATRLAESFQLLNIQADHTALGDKSFFRLADTNEKIYSYESGSMEELLCMSDMVFSIAADAGYVYLGVSPKGQEEQKLSTIVRHPH